MVDLLGLIKEVLGLINVAIYIKLHQVHYLILFVTYNNILCPANKFAELIVTESNNSLLK